MIQAFFTGFFLGISLIIAIGAQNTFVLRQGIIGRHIFYVALFCAISDALLIIIGVAGLSIFANNFDRATLEFFFGFSALWLFGYGIVRLKAVFKSTEILKIEASRPQSLFKTLSILSILTFANPHVYLDTMILIGSISQQFIGANKLSFALGASLASFVFFFSLAYGSKLLASRINQPSYSRTLDFLIALIMFIIATKLAIAGNWF